LTICRLIRESICNGIPNRYPEETDT
jgi:hypothetical protein